MIEKVIIQKNFLIEQKTFLKKVIVLGSKISCFFTLFLMQSTYALAMQQWHLDDEGYKYDMPEWISFIVLFFIAAAIYNKYSIVAPIIGSLLGIYLTYKGIQNNFLHSNDLYILGMILFTLFSLYFVLIVSKDKIYTQKSTDSENKNFQNRKEKNIQKYNGQLKNNEEKVVVPFPKTRPKNLLNNNNLENEETNYINPKEIAEVPIKHGIWESTIGAKVKHKILGTGKITGIDEHYVNIKFLVDEDESVFDNEAFEDGLFLYLKVKDDKFEEINKFINDRKETNQMFEKFYRERAIAKNALRKHAQKKYLNKRDSNHYLNHCWNCKSTIDSDLCEKDPGYGYICNDCGASLKDYLE